MPPQPVPKAVPEPKQPIVTKPLAKTRRMTPGKLTMEEFGLMKN
jgi:hypothetical protein